MKNKENEIEDLFRKRFGNDEAPVSDRVWENIKNTLPPEKPGRTFPFYLLIAFLLGVGTAGYVLYRMFDSSDNQNTLANNENIDQNKTEKNSLQLADFSHSIDSKNKRGQNENEFKNEDENKLNEHSSSDFNNEKKINAETGERELLNVENSAKKNISKTDNRNIKNWKSKKSGNNLNTKKENKVNNKRNNPASENYLAYGPNENTEKNNKDQKINKNNKSNTGDEDKTDLNVKNQQEENNGKEINIIDEKLSNDEFNKNKESSNSINNLETLTSKEDDKTKSNLPVSDLTGKSNNNENLPLASVAPDSITEIVKDTMATKADSSAVAQEKDEEKKKEKKTFSPAISVDLFLGPAYTNQPAADFQSPYETQKGKFNLSGGGRINIGLNDKFSISTGIGYISYAHQNKFYKESIENYKKIQNDTIWYQNGIDWDYYVTSDTIKMERNTVYSHSSKNYYRYLEVPLAISYTLLSTSKIKLAVTAGASINFLLQSHSSRMVESDSIFMPYGQYTVETYGRGANSPFKSVVPGAFINPSISYNIKERWAVFAEPGFRFLLGSVYKEKEYNVKPYAFNLSFGLRYIIK